MDAFKICSNKKEKQTNEKETKTEISLHFYFLQVVIWIDDSPFSLWPQGIKLRAMGEGGRQNTVQYKNQFSSSLNSPCTIYRLASSQLFKEFM